MRHSLELRVAAEGDVTDAPEVAGAEQLGIDPARLAILLDRVGLEVESGRWQIGRAHV